MGVAARVITVRWGVWETWGQGYHPRWSERFYSRLLEDVVREAARGGEGGGRDLMF